MTQKVRDESDLHIAGLLPADAADGTVVVPIDATARRMAIQLADRGKRLPPASDIHAEANLLASLLWAGTYAPETMNVDAVRDILDRREMFLSAPHGAIFEAICAMRDRNEVGDYTAVHSELVRKKQDRDAGGMDYLERLVAGATSTTEAKLRIHAASIREMWCRRELASVARMIEEAANTGQRTSAEIIDGISEAFGLVADKSSANTSSLITFRQALHMVTDTLADPAPPSLLTGLRDLDYATGGLFQREVTVLGARTSVGKSALSTQISINIGLARPDIAILMVTLEMAADKFAGRVVASYAKLPYTKIRQHTTNPLERVKIGSVASTIAAAGVYFADSQSQTIMSIHALAKALTRAIAREGKRIGLIVIDHIGLVKGSSQSAKRNREQEVAETSRGLLFLSKEHDCHVMGLAQISRESERGKDTMPKLHHLRESGSIEQDTDNVWLLHRDRDTNGMFVPDVRARLAIAKARHGETTLIELGVDMQRMMFVDTKS